MSLFYFFHFIENRLFSLAIYPYHRFPFPSTPPTIWYTLFFPPTGKKKQAWDNNKISKNKICPFDIIYFCVSLERTGLLRDSNKIQKNIIRKNKNNHIEVGQGKCTEGKEPQRRYKKQRLTHSCTREYHTNTKMKALIYTQRTLYIPACGLCLLLLSLWVHMTFVHVDLEGLVHLVFSVPFGS